MKYDHELWNDYTKENAGVIQEKLADFIYHITLALDAKKILEVGCNVGNNLARFPSKSDVTPLVVPFSTTLAPGRGASIPASITVPETVVCAIVVVIKAKNVHRAIKFLKSLLVFMIVSLF